MLKAFRVTFSCARGAGWQDILARTPGEAERALMDHYKDASLFPISAREMLYCEFGYHNGKSFCRRTHFAQLPSRNKQRQSRSRG